jgi:glucosamine kinase
MIIVADSGSTKADWKLIGKQGVESVGTMGFNPVFHSSEVIKRELDKALGNAYNRDEATHVYYYGSGCWDEKRQEIVSSALRQIFSHADVEVEHDLLGAARATCGNDPGIACILGTGSNTCLFDGNDVTDNVTNLGYLAGDEGSGTHIAKKLIRAYFYRELPPELVDALEQVVPGGKDEILDRLYGQEPPNVYMASFTRFMGAHREHFFIQKLLYNSFVEFIDRHIRKYKGHLSLPVHFIGSIAFTFQDLIKIALQERDIHPGVFIKKPIDQLVTFHTQQQ